jgi:carboxyl-terminal processing protease
VSQKQLKELVSTAKAEGYYEQAKDAFDLLESKLKHDVATDIDKHEDILRQILELDIIAAYYYQAGSIEAGLKYDKQLREAIRLLQSPEEYKKLLTPKKAKETTQLIGLPKKQTTPVALKKKPLMTVFDAIA